MGHMDRIDMAENKDQWVALVNLVISLMLS